MRPHAQYPDFHLFLKYLVHQAVPDSYAPGIRAAQITDQFFKGRRTPVRIFRQDFDQAKRPRFESGCGDFF
jgi:hypothetical protein